VKILFVTSIERGGPLEQALVLARALVADGHTVGAVCATPSLAERFAAAGATPSLIPLRHALDLPRALAVTRVARGADVVHSHDRRSGLWVRLGPRPRKGGLRVSSVHGLPDPYHPTIVGHGSPGLRARLAYRTLDGTLYRRADAIVVPSRAVAEDLATRLGYPRARMTVVPNGIELDVRTGGSRDALIGTVSVLEAAKGLDVFLRAAAVLARERPAMRFAMFGAGSQAAALDRLTRELGLDGRVERPGFVAGADAWSRLGVYVLSSWAETAPMALLEAMAARVPIVATAVGGVPEIVDETTARLVPPGDPARLAAAIADVVDDAAATDRRVQAARARVEAHFSAQANQRAIVDLYERLIA